MSEAGLTVHCSKHEGRIAKLLAAKGVTVLPVESAERSDRYLLSDRVAIERKTAQDFLNSIMDKRLFVEATEMGENFAVPLFIIEGEDLYGIRGFHPNAIRGAISALMVQYGVSLLSTKTDVETAALITWMATHEQQGVPEVSLHPKRKALELADQQRRVVEMLPGVGMVGARELLQHFGSVARVVNAGPDEFEQIRGLGRKKVERIKAVLAAEYESIDTERNVEEAIEYDPRILFRFAVTQIARQHVLFDEGGQKWVVDLAYISERKRQLFVVELKRGELLDEHLEQLATYLDNVRRSELFAAFLDEGYEAKGILASPGEAKLTVKDKRILVRSLPPEPILRALKAMRDDRLAEGDAARAAAR